MATERLYYTDSYLREFTADVIETDTDGRRVYLDRTAFYPASGGQPHDVGMLDERTVLDVVDEDGRIAHLLDGPVKPGRVEGRIDWSRRYDHMQQHTGQHLLSAILIELFRFETLSFHLGPEVSTIEINTPEFTEAQIERAEERANEAAREARAVNVTFEDAQTARDLRKPSARSGVLRIIEISELDRSACGGTHVRSTSELSPILIRRTEKIRGNTRLEFVCGARAQRRARQDFRILSDLSRLGAVPPEQLPELFRTVRARLSDAEKQAEAIAIELARRDGEALYAKAEPDEDGIRRVMITHPKIDGTLRAKAQAFVDQPKAVALAVGGEPRGVIVACSPDSGFNAGAILKQVLSAAGGRGGGSPVIAQGSVPHEGIVAALTSALGFRSGTQRD